jgi:hypothetical protein
MVIRRVAVAALAAVVLVLGAALPAQAAPSGGVLGSTDGATFSSALPSGLFPSTTVMIPGAVRTATLYVKNDSSVPSQLFVSASRVVVSSPAFAQSLSLRATSASSPATTAVRLDRVAGCAALLAQPLAPGAVTELTLTLAMADVAERVAQGDSLSATLGVALVESDTSITPTSGCDLSGIQLPVLALPDPDGGLAFTGSAILYPALMAVGVLLGAGTLFVLAARRRGRHAR